MREADFYYVTLPSSSINQLNLFVAALIITSNIYPNALIKVFCIQFLQVIDWNTISLRWDFNLNKYPAQLRSHCRFHHLFYLLIIFVIQIIIKRGIQWTVACQISGIIWVKIKTFIRKCPFLCITVLLNCITEEISHLIYLGCNIHYGANFDVNNKTYGTKQATRNERDNNSNSTKWW
jgi:hypothetical protein